MTRIGRLWSRRLHLIATQINASTGFSPQEIMYGVRLRTRADAVFPHSEEVNFSDVPSYCACSKQSREGISQSVVENIEYSQELMRRIYDRGSKETDVKSRDWVWLRNDARTHSLSPMFRGPWLVLDRRSVNVHLSDPSGNLKAVVHLNRCKKAAKPSYLDGDRSFPYLTTYASEGVSTGATCDSGNGANASGQQHADVMEYIDAVPKSEVESGEALREGDETDTLRRSSRQRKEPEWYGERVVWPSSKGKYK